MQSRGCQLLLSQLGSVMLVLLGAEQKITVMFGLAGAFSVESMTDWRALCPPCCLGGPAQYHCLL